MIILQFFGPIGQLLVCQKLPNQGLWSRLLKRLIQTKEGLVRSCMSFG